MSRNTLWVVILLALMIGGGCQSTPKRTVLPAPVGTQATASRHSEDGMWTYQQQLQQAKQHFEAAVAASADLAEAHYNLGLTLQRLNAIPQGDAPGNQVIWNAPPLHGIKTPDKEPAGMSSDGYMHSH